ncbi:hypothetical protein KUCAC02_003112 [Chaenocephalus aceratus]|uniref:Uncharacterized protein n=1 Tax=Chaenocephalus aceratus TaxID=36190 RepID=A0ACB9WK06_CHAAC|nr:hypothetical protein KUCAC02_003112 [Chaenocephalus aceratus]
MGNCHTVGPNEALVVSGGCCGSDQKTYVVGGWAWAWWLISDIQRITLEIMTLQPKCDDVETAEGVALTVTGVAQVKVMTEHELLGYACEQFLGNQWWKSRVASPDVGRMGIEILSFTIKDLYDKPQLQRDADIGVAEAERDAGIREAECKREMMDVKFLADTKDGRLQTRARMQKASFNQEVNTKKAEAQLAYELQAAKEHRRSVWRRLKSRWCRGRSRSSSRIRRSPRTEKELTATVKRPAEAEAYKMQQLAEGHKIKAVLTAQAEAEKIRLIGEAEASSIEVIGKAEALRMKLKAEAYQQYGEAAKTALVLEALPLIASAVAAPLAKTGEIVILSGEGSRVTGELNRLLAELPVSVNALTGVDLTKNL